MKNKITITHLTRLCIYALLTVVLSCQTTKLVHPHGKGCGCKMTKQYSPGLGCPCPTNILHIKSSNIGIGDPVGSPGTLPFEVCGDVIKRDTSDNAKMFYYRNKYACGVHIDTEIHIQGLDTTIRLTIKDNVDYKIGHPCPTENLSITKDSLNNR